MFSAVTFDQVDAQGAQLVAHRRVDTGVTAGDGMAQFTRQRREPTHERTADAKNMDVHGAILDTA